MLIQRSFTAETIVTKITKVLFLLQMTLKMVIERTLSDKCPLAILAFVGAYILVISRVESQLVLCGESGKGQRVRLNLQRKVLLIVDRKLCKKGTYVFFW